MEGGEFEKPSSCEKKVIFKEFWKIQYSWKMGFTQQ